MIQYHLTGIDEEGNTPVEIALPTDVAINVIRAMVETGVARIVVNGEAPAEVPKIEKPAAVKTPAKKSAAAPAKHQFTTKRQVERAMVTQETVQKILKLKANGMKPKDIAAMTGVKIASVYAYTAPSYKGLGAAATPPIKQSPASPQRTSRPIMSKPNYDRVKVSFQHGVPEGDIAHQLTLPMEEVKRAVLCRDYETYTKVA